jgi:hypothetical protein
MKSEYGDRDTLGTQILQTQEEHDKSSSIEIGDLSHELGKGYMKGLIDCIEIHRNSIGKYYIEVKTQKNPLFPDRALNITYEAVRHLPLMEHNMDVWYVNNAIDKLEILWSLPHISEFAFYLAHKHKYSKKLIEWIEIYEGFREKVKKKR